MSSWRRRCATCPRSCQPANSTSAPNRSGADDTRADINTCKVRDPPSTSTECSRCCRNTRRRTSHNRHSRGGRAGECGPMHGHCWLRSLRLQSSHRFRGSRRRRELSRRLHGSRHSISRRLRDRRLQIETPPEDRRLRGGRRPRRPPPARPPPPWRPPPEKPPPARPPP